MALVSPRGQIRSTSTRVPSPRSGSSYTRRTRTFRARHRLPPHAEGAHSRASVTLASAGARRPGRHHGLWPLGAACTRATRLRPGRDGEHGPAQAVQRSRLAASGQRAAGTKIPEADVRRGCLHAVGHDLEQDQAHFPDRREHERVSRAIPSASSAPGVCGTRGDHELAVSYCSNGGVRRRLPELRTFGGHLVFGKTPRRSPTSTCTCTVSTQPTSPSSSPARASHQPAIEDD